MIHEGLKESGSFLRRSVLRISIALSKSTTTFRCPSRGLVQRTAYDVMPPLPNETVPLLRKTQKRVATDGIVIPIPAASSRRGRKA